MEDFNFDDANDANSKQDDPPGPTTRLRHPPPTVPTQFLDFLPAFYTVKLELLARERTLTRLVFGPLSCASRTGNRDSRGTAIALLLLLLLQNNCSRRILGCTRIFVDSGIDHRINLAIVLIAQVIRNIVPRAF